MNGSENLDQPVQKVFLSFICCMMAGVLAWWALLRFVGRMMNRRVLDKQSVNRIVKEYIVNHHH